MNGPLVMPSDLASCMSILRPLSERRRIPPGIIRKLSNPMVRFWTNPSCLFRCIRVMASLTLRNIHKSFGNTAVLSGIDLDVADGEFAVIVGPSGCGKSTLLRTIAGLEEIDQGTIKIGETDVSRLPPSERGIAMVFQSYALYPHMTVYDNM